MDGLGRRSSRLRATLELGRTWHHSETETHPSPTTHSFELWKSPKQSIGRIQS